MSERKVGFDRAKLDKKIVLDDDKYLVLPAILASEIVHKYSEGWAYKPAEELEKAAWTADGRWVTILKHPDTALLQNTRDIHGRIENPRYAKDLLDIKTRRPNRKGIRADIKWFKDRVPPPVLEQIRTGELSDVSIGFTYEEDLTPGMWNGQKYDYVQRNIFLDHVAAPIEKGRCPGPVCGIAVDSVVHTGKAKSSAEDELVVQETSDSITVPLGAKCDVTMKVSVSEDDSVHALVCGEDNVISSYVFSKLKGWTVERAEEWIGAHKKMSLDMVVAVGNCDICREIEALGTLESSKRLALAYGKDKVVGILKGVKPSKPVVKIKPESVEDLLISSKRAREAVRWVFQ